LQNITFPAPANESAPEQIHQAVVDPTGQYMIFPSLGADTVHVYCIDPVTHLLTEHAPLKSKQGYGPRHAVFWTGTNSTTTYLFVVHEKANKITSYEVCYLEQGGLAFTEVDEVSTYGNQTVPPATFASEMTLSPDNKFLIAANRNGTVFTVENSDPNNSTQLPSDSLVTFKPSADGKLSFVQLAKSGGVYPRHFGMNQNGSLIAVANQLSKNVNIYARNLETGLIEDGKAVARADNLGPGDLM
jgi:6-phosphogluconolactonase (cycloisomerase 2 family)